MQSCEASKDCLDSSSNPMFHFTYILSCLLFDRILLSLSLSRVSRGLCQGKSAAERAKEQGLHGLAAKLCADEK